VSQRGGAYEHEGDSYVGGSYAGDSGSAGLNPMQRMLNKS
jgi:hypothetical protein